MTTKSAKQPMESLSGKVPLALYQAFVAYCQDHQLTKSEAMRDLLSRSLFEVSLRDEIAQLLASEHRTSREENRQLTALVVGNIGSKSPPERSQIPLLVEQTVAYAHAKLAGV